MQRAATTPTDSVSTSSTWWEIVLLTSLATWLYLMLAPAVHSVNTAKLYWKGWLNPTVGYFLSLPWSSFTKSCPAKLSGSSHAAITPRTYRASRPPEILPRPSRASSSARDLAPCVTSWPRSRRLWSACALAWPPPKSMVSLNWLLSHSAAFTAARVRSPFSFLGPEEGTRNKQELIRAFQPIWSQVAYALSRRERG